MKISVALCTYCGERFLPDQLKSLAAQTRPPDELVVTDDGSTDGTLAILEDFKRDAPFPVSISRNTQQLGFILNFEQAISKCGGDVIAPCDQDDVWYPGKLARMAAIFEAEQEIGLVFCDADVVRADLAPLGRSTWERRGFGLARQQRMAADGAFDQLLERNVISGNSMAFRASILPLASPFYASWAHDHWVALLVAATGRIKPLPERLLAYRQHSENLRGATGSLSRQVERASTGDRAQFLKLAESHRLLRERLGRLPEGPRRDRLIALVDGKIDFLETRAGMSAHRLQRIPLVAREVLRGSYARYARKGLLTALRDVLW